MDLRKIALDTTKEADGVWIDIGDGASLKIARKGNPAYNKLFVKLSKPYVRMAKTGTLPEEKAQELLAETTSKTILLDWKNLELDGKKVSYSPAKAKEILLNREFEPFKKMVEELSEDEAHFRQEEIEKEVGEPQTTLNGT